MKILIITHSFPPALSPRAIRWQRVIEQLRSSGHSIDVVCGRAPDSLAVECVDGVSIYRCGGGLLERIRRRLKRPTAQASDGRRAPAPGLASRLAKWVHDRFWKQLYWPDYACLWYPAALRCAERLVRSNTPDVMISVSPPFTAHLVALGLRRRFAHLRWLVDIGDPFALLDGAEVNNAALYRSLNLWIERRVVGRCDAVSVTTERTAQMYIEAFGIEPAGICVVPPIVGAPDRSTVVASGAPAADEIRAVYAGSFYRGIREPDRMIAVLEGVLACDPGLSRRLRLEVFGDLGEFAARFERAPTLKSVMRLHGAVTPERLAGWLRSAHVLINVGNTTSYQLPSKIVEYMAECKPILNICQIAEDACAELLSTYPLALSVTDDGKDATIRRVATFLCDAPRSVIDPQLVAELTRRFRPVSVAGQYEAILRSVVDDGATSRNRQ